MLLALGGVERTDAQLLLAWRNTDHAAGQALFERHFTAVARFFANKVSADVDDLVQETFMACLRNRDQLRDPEGFRSWLFGVAYNVLRMYYRRRVRDEARFDPQVSSVHDLAPGPSTWVRERAEERLLLDALRRLPLELQVVLELYYWEQLTSARIAEVVGRPHGTVRSQLRRGREQLREVMTAQASSAGLESQVGDESVEQWARGLREGPAK